MRSSTEKKSIARKFILILTTALVFTMMLGCTSGVAYAKKKKNTVKIGHARIDEKGTMVGKKPGDQKGSEVASSTYYYRKNTWAGWLFAARANDPEAARAIATAMKQAVKNNNIGYGKSYPQLSDYAEAVNYNLSLVSTPCNCDCIGLVSVCLAAAGLELNLDSSSPDDTFTYFTSKQFLKKGKQLQPGDILYTSNSKAHHAAIVIKSKNKITGADPNPTSKYTVGKTYVALDDLELKVGPGSSYFPVNDGEDGAAYLSEGTTFICLEARRNYIKTSGGWVCGTDVQGEEYVKAA